MFQRVKRKLKMIAMNQIKYLHFAENKQSLDIENLNSCTIVVIASSTDVILDHFFSLSQDASVNAVAEDAHIQVKMNQISALLKNHKQNFSTNDSIELIAYAVYRGEIALPSQKTIIESHFKQ